MRARGPCASGERHNLARVRWRLALILLFLFSGLSAVPALAAAPAPSSPPAVPVLTLHGPASVRAGHPAALAGTLSAAPPGTVVHLYRTHPYGAVELVRSAAVAADGSFRFAVYPDRTTTYEVTAVLTPAPAPAQVTVGVFAAPRVDARALTLGRAEVSLAVIHPADLRWNGARVRWTFITPHGRTIAILATRTRQRSPRVTLLDVTLALPAGPFRWRACFHAPQDHALLDPGGPPGCSGRGYTGIVRLPEGYPGPGLVARAIGFLRGRAGKTGMAVIDSEGRLSGWHEHWRFVSASVVKAMLLVAYLRRLHRLGLHSVGSANNFLYPMIHVSDNSAATQTWSIVGDGGLGQVAFAAGMTDFSISGIWANAQISAADQARFFFRMDSLIPPEFVGYARFLLSTIAGYESWGIPAVARPRGYAVFFKGGWRGTSLGQLVHQVGRLEGHGRTWSMAVMTDGDPSMGYGIDTIQGVTARLL
jgi:hypothetical protein